MWEEIWIYMLRIFQNMILVKMNLFFWIRKDSQNIKAFYLQESFWKKREHYLWRKAIICFLRILWELANTLLHFQKLTRQLISASRSNSPSKKLSLSWFICTLTTLSLVFPTFFWRKIMFLRCSWTKVLWLLEKSRCSSWKLQGRVFKRNCGRSFASNFQSQISRSYHFASFPDWWL